MKQYIKLLSFTLIVVAAILFCGIAAKNSMTFVNAVKLNTLTVQNTVICSGTVEASSESSVYSTGYSEVDQVYVQVGDSVTAGQKLMDVSHSLSDSLPSYDSAYEEAYNTFLSSADQSQQEETLSSPVSGIVTSVAASSKGSVLKSSDPAVTIRSDSGIQVRLSVDESKIADIHVGQRARITGVGFKNSTYYGTVKSIATSAKQVTNLTGKETVVDVIVTVENPGTDILPGFTAKAEIAVSQNTDEIIVPYEAVCAETDGSEYVYLLNDNKAVKTPIVTGNEYDSGLEVTQGLSADDTVILNVHDVSNGKYVIANEDKAVSSDD